MWCSSNWTLHCWSLTSCKPRRFHTHYQLFLDRKEIWDILHLILLINKIQSDGTVGFMIINKSNLTSAQWSCSPFNPPSSHTSGRYIAPLMGWQWTMSFFVSTFLMYTCRFFFFFCLAEKDNERWHILRSTHYLKVFSSGMFFSLNRRRAPSHSTLPSHFTKCFIVGAKQLKVINNFKTQ